uniref:G domain-containing protein n=1 Tax=Denticeps clupeoides TaxID=299321 RepID=A0AAY3ZVD0_9TELE
MKEDLRNLVISNPEVKQLRILLHGPVGAGKSSFINAIDSIFQGRMACASLAEAATAGTSFTKVYGSYLPFVISDIMGLQPCESEGAHQDDLIQALEGRLMDGYKFNPISPLSESDQGYKPNPSNSDKTHCLVSIIPASKISLMDNKIIEKMRKIREKASDMGIPQVVVLTMVDQACPEVNKNLKMIYRSKKIKEKRIRLVGLVPCIICICNPPLMFISILLA